MTLGCYYYFFKDSRALLELIFYVSKYKYTLHFDFFFFSLVAVGNVQISLTFCTFYSFVFYFYL